MGKILYINNDAFVIYLLIFVKNPNTNIYNTTLVSGSKRISKTTAKNVPT